MTSRYRAYELVIQSEILLLGFSPCTDDSSDADIMVRMGKLPALPTEGPPWQCGPSEMTLWLQGVGAFCAREGREVVVDPQENVPLSRLAFALRSSVWAALMMQRGLLPLHACCLQSEQGCLLLVGPVGIGKSTLATALTYRGFQMLSDEMSVLRLRDDGVEVLPSFPEIRLWAESLEAFGIPAEAWGVPLRPPMLKFSLAVPSWCSKAARPCAMFFLSQRRDPEVERQRLPPAYALARIHHFLYRSRFLAEMPGLSETVREMLNSLVLNSGCYTLQFPSDLNLVPELCEEVIQGLDDLASGRASREPEAPPHWTQGLMLPRFHLAPSAPPPNNLEGLRGLALLASYPKSGNTWMRALLTAWRREHQEVQDIETLDGGHPLFLRHHLDEVLGIDTDYLKPGEVLEQRSHLHKLEAPYLTEPTLVKTHDACTRGRDGELLFPAQTLAGIIYIVRCPLDVVLSAMNHYQTTAEQTVKIMADKLAWGELRMSGISEIVPQFSSCWSGHVKSWLDEPSYRLLVVRYEDLLLDTLGELKKITDFLEYPWDEERGLRAVDKTKFERLQEQEKRKGFRERPIHTPAFFRQGKAGGWRDSLPPELARHIAADHGQVMRRLGYGAEVEELLN